MKNAVLKLHSVRGVSVWIVVMLLAVLAMLALCAAPSLRAAREANLSRACDIALAEAQRRIDEDATLSGYTLDADAARYAVVRDYKRWSELCPGGGDCWLMPKDGGGWTVVCALHTKDDRLKTRLNAENALRQLRTALDGVRGRGEEAPENVGVTINGAPLTVARVDQAPEIKRGTRATSGYTGTVAFYSAGADGDAAYFCYADPEHCVDWHGAGGWTMLDD